LVTVKTGTITFYMGDDPSCSAHVHAAGTTFFENGGMVGMARNEGTVDASVLMRRHPEIALFESNPIQRAAGSF